jgi:hypothetical protein
MYYPEGSVTVGCRTNGDCTAAPHGHCTTEFSEGFGGAPTVTCHYGCVSDAECGAGRLCFCGDPIGQCVETSCKTDADCPSGVLCMEGAVPSGCGSTPRFACGPLCKTDADCSSIASGSVCRDGNCANNFVCGRPFLVQGSARVAPSTSRGDWGFSLTPDVAGVHVGVRRVLADHYTEMGLMEHASIAAFARFSLELLALGAPPELVALATDALGDETRHARACFGLAKAYGGARVGPGPLPLGGVLGGASFEGQVTTAFLEACVGESLAAIEVAEAAARATDPVIASTLQQIAEDETRHAALGFRFVQWALEQVDSRERAALVTKLGAAAAGTLRDMDTPSEPAQDDEELLVAHGWLPARVRRELRRAAMENTVLPCVRALLAGSRARPLAA